MAKINLILNQTKSNSGNIDLIKKQQDLISAQKNTSRDSLRYLEISDLANAGVKFIHDDLKNTIDRNKEYQSSNKLLEAKYQAQHNALDLQNKLDQDIKLFIPTLQQNLPQAQVQKHVEEFYTRLEQIENTTYGGEAVFSDVTSNRIVDISDNARLAIHDTTKSDPAFTKMRAALDLLAQGNYQPTSNQIQEASEEIKAAGHAIEGLILKNTSAQNQIKNVSESNAKVISNAEEALSNNFHISITEATMIIKDLTNSLNLIQTMMMLQFKGIDRLLSITPS